MISPSRTRLRTGCVRSALVAALAAAFAPITPLTAQTANEYGYPPRLAPRPTTAAITDAELMTHIYIFADDSMMGRQSGRVGNMKGTAYIARELARLGVEPAGDGGTYFQSLPYVLRRYGANSSLMVNGRPLRWLDDFVAVPGRAAPLPLSGVTAIYGGIAGDTARQIPPALGAGKLVVLSGPVVVPAAGGRGGGGRGGAAGGPARFADAAAVATIDLHNLSPAARALINDPPATLNTGRGGAPPTAATPAPAMFRITPEAAAQIFGQPIEGLAPGTAGGTVTARLEYLERPVPEFGRNVVGIIRGSDPALASEYIAIGAHNDHVGFTASPVDHDSLRAFASAALALQMQTGELVALTPEQRASIRVDLTALRRLRPARLDSIRNGADDDGSGSMAMLEIAEAIAAMPVKPRRSILFVWHTGEEGGLSGSRWFVENPTVPRESIVAQINLDMIGRGRTTDIPGGGDDYLGVVGSKRLSSELGGMVASVNARQDRPFRLDYKFDAETTWPGYNNIYGRSDHANYARYDIPIAFFFTGLHQDYHQVTDEPQYLDYPHYAAITRYLRDLVVEVGNRDRRPVVDKPGTD